MYPERELQWERLTTGTVVNGVLPEMGFWPPDLKRMSKPHATKDDIKHKFTKEYLDKQK